MFRYFGRTSTNASRKAPAVTRVGTRVVAIATSEIDPEFRWPPAPGVLRSQSWCLQMIKVLATYLVFPNVHDWSLTWVQDEMLSSVISAHGNHKTTSTEASRSCRRQIK